MKNATGITVSAFGALVGLAGIEHGIGEIFQGNIAPGGLMILSWPGEGPFSVLAGEPAMTILPNLLMAGVLTILTSLFFLVCVIRFIDSKHGSMALVLTSIILLLVGGGIFPPVFGIILAIIGRRIYSSSRSLQAKPHPGAWRMMAARVWPWSLGIGLVTWLSMMPGLPLLAYFFGLGHNAELVLTLALGMIGFLFLSVFTGFASDALRVDDADSKGTVQVQSTSSAVVELKG